MTRIEGVPRASANALVRLVYGLSRASSSGATSTLSACTRTRRAC